MKRLYEAIRFAYLITIERHSSLRYFFRNALWHYREGLPVGYIMNGDDFFKS